MGSKLGGMAPKLPGYSNADKLGQAVASTLPGLGSGSFGLAGTSIGQTTGF